MVKWIRVGCCEEGPGARAHLSHPGDRVAEAYEASVSPLVALDGRTGILPLRREQHRLGVVDRRLPGTFSPPDTSAGLYDSTMAWRDRARA
jgi:hypothetical protein